MSSKDRCDPETRARIVKENLKMWKPGQSGNPAGKKPGTRNSLRTRMKHMLQKEPCIEVLEKLREMGIDLEHRDNAEAIAYAAGFAAAMGDMKAVKMISEITDEPFARDLNLNADFNIVMDETDQKVL